MPQPLVSVVICTYNQQAFVRETVESVLAQTYPCLEVILTDDGSTDNTPDVLRQYAQQFPGRVKVALSQKNTGIPANFNRGLALATGDLLVCMDGDDLMFPLKIEKQVAYLKQHPGAIGCYHDSEVFESETGRVLGRMSQVYNGAPRLKQGNIAAWFTPRNFFLPGAIMYRATYRPPHGYDERLKYLSEVVFFVEVFRTGQLEAMAETLMRYRRHAHNVTDDAAARGQMVEYELVAYAILEARYPELHPMLTKLRRSCRLAQAVKCYREGNPALGKTIIFNLIREGHWMAGLATLVGMTLLGKGLTQATGGPVAARPGWLKRLARFILK